MKFCPDLKTTGSRTNKKPVAELVNVQHVLVLDCSFLLSNSLSLLAEQQQFISFKLKMALQRLTTLVLFSCYWLKGKGMGILIVKTCTPVEVCLGNYRDETKVQ